ncbi:hypothetical protein RWE15_07130 [Virgibacillus halophilus]|uniref:Uncharacterized protein n=2 Tax=Tigheibacillus halophilus TaxID=361280 RepID=A0ABU5C4R1_9BACI|nr:hypothetical protein [Virgibacillus halophilus]
MKDFYSPYATYLLMNESDEKVAIKYDENKQAILEPQIGPRPPYYCHPRYEQYYPLI